MAQSPLFFTPTPEIYPHSWDPAGDALFCVRLSEDAFRRASFLDQRVLTPTTPGRWYAWTEGLSAAEALSPPPEPHFIFHIGHVGSTLLSRLLGAHPKIFALREPATLRVLAELHRDLEAPESRLSPDAVHARLEVLVKLWGRGWWAGQRALVKATSLACDLSGPLLARLASTRALFMFVPPDAYLASILGAPNSPADIAAMAPARLRRLHRALGDRPWRLWRLSPGETVAMSWACEMLALRTTAAAAPGAVQWIEFDRFLAAPAQGLTRCLAHLGVDVQAGAVEAIVAGPIMRQYSKAPEHAFDANLRRQLLRAAWAEHGGEIAKGLAWLEASARDYPAIAEALAFSAGPYTA